MTENRRTKAKLYKRYPLSSLLIYNGTTILHCGLDPCTDPQFFTPIAYRAACSDRIDFIPDFRDFS